MTTTPPVTFDYATFILRYPEFAGVGAPLMQMYFDEAALFCTNATTNPFFCGGTLPTLLNLATAHIAWLNAPRGPDGLPANSGTPAAPIVGRISQASEGSVSVSTEMGNSSSGPSEEWFNQTKYGAEYWQAAGRFRNSGRYVPPVQNMGFVGWPGGLRNRFY